MLFLDSSLQPLSNGGLSFSQAVAARQLGQDCQLDLGNCCSCWLTLVLDTQHLPRQLCLVSCDDQCGRVKVFRYPPAWVQAVTNSVHQHWEWKAEHGTSPTDPSLELRLTRKVR